MIIEKNGKPYAIPPFDIESAKLKVKSGPKTLGIRKDPARGGTGLQREFRMAQSH